MGNAEGRVICGAVVEVMGSRAWDGRGKALSREMGWTARRVVSVRRVVARATDRAVGRVRGRAVARVAGWLVGRSVCAG